VVCQVPPLGRWSARGAPDPRTEGPYGRGFQCPG
jgi:hypothetical protein